MGLRVIYVFTHDSIALGQDGSCLLYTSQFTPVEQRVGAVFVRKKLEGAARRPPPLTAGMPGSIIIVGGGAAGNAAAETLRHEGYSGRVIMLSADESMPCDRPNPVSYTHLDVYKRQP